MDNLDKAFWAKRRVFVTGCSGIVGSWLTERLVKLGATVVGLLRDVPSRSPLKGTRTNRGATYVFGCLEDITLLERAINEHEIDTVFHLAAQAIVGTANRSPLSTFEANIRGTWNLLEACRRLDGSVQRIIIASSDKAYGTQPTLPYTEDMPLQGMHPYDVSKSCTDLIAQAYFNTYRLPVCITRCGNIFGGRDLNFNRIVPGTIRSVANGQRPVIRSDGSLTRDYLYIRDVVNAYLELAQQMDDSDIHGEAFNFSGENPISVLELTKKILALMDRQDLEPSLLGKSNGEIRHQYLSAAKARRVLGWEPHYALDEALSETIRWYSGYFRHRSAVSTVRRTSQLRHQEAVH